jgi:hypothetical protein
LSVKRGSERAAPAARGRRDPWMPRAFAVGYRPRMPFSTASLLRVLGLFCAGLGAGYAVAHYTQESGTRAARPGGEPAARPAAPLRTDDRPPRPELRAELPASKPAMPATRAAPLPPPDSRIVDNYTALARRARDGDAAAARRLAEDLGGCARLDQDMSLTQDLLDDEDVSDDDEDLDAAQAAQRLERRRRLTARAEAELKKHRRVQARCEGTATLDTGAGEWLRQAAANGDAEAGLCFALFPNRWESRLLSPRWLDDLDAAAAQAPQLLRRAFDAGQPEAAAALSVMYQPAQARAYHIHGSPWLARIGDDPYWAFAYAVVAQRGLRGDAARRWTAQALRLEQALPPQRAAQARAWADAQLARISFVPAEPRPGDSYCRRMRVIAAY